jgi:hypothetical protein
MERNPNDIMFLKEKINAIKIALFRSEMNSEWKLPNNIVQTIKVEDDGTVWFFTTLKGNAAAVDKPFFVHLDFYKKGADCHLQLSGEGVIVDDADQGVCAINSYLNGQYTHAAVMVKMKITHAEYYDKTILSNISWPQKIKTAINHLFLPQHRIYNFS